MLFVALVTFIAVYNFRHIIRLDMVKNKIIRIGRSNNGDDQRHYTSAQRPINCQNVTETSVQEIKLMMDKLDLLKVLENEYVAEHDKMRLIYASHFLDELNPHIIRAANLTKGLRW
jgi:hypothetical protein